MDEIFLLGDCRRSKRPTKRKNYALMNDGECQMEKTNTISVTKCHQCNIGVEKGDDLINIVWYGCDVCPKWWHRHCLPTHFQAQADLSCMDQSTDFRCPSCPLEKSM